MHIGNFIVFEILKKICQLIISQCIAAIVLPIVLVIYISHHVVFRSCLGLYLWIRFRGKMKLVDNGGDAMFGYQSEGNTRNILIALECQQLPEKEDKNDMILKIIHTKIGNKQPYEKLLWIFTEHLGYFCWKYDENFDITNHMINLDEEEVVDRARLLRLVERLGENMAPEHPQWQFIFIPRYLNENGSKSTAIILRFHHGLLDGLSFVTFMSHALGSLAVDPTTVMPEPDPSTFPYALNPIEFPISLKNRVLFNINCILFGFYHLLRTVTSTHPHWQLRTKYPGKEKNYEFSDLIDTKRLAVIRERFGVSVPSILAFAFLQGLERVAGERCPPVVKVGHSLAILPYPDACFHNRFTLMTVPFERNSNLSRLKQLQVYHKSSVRALQGPEYFLYFWFFQFYGKFPASLLKYVLKEPRFSFFLTNLPFAVGKVAALNHRINDVVGWPPYTTDAGIGFISVGYCGKMRLGVTADSSWLTKDELERVVQETIREIISLAQECSFSECIL